MTAYTANLTITATTAWDTWYSYSDRACNDTAKVYRWYVATFFSAKAQARYEWIGNMIGTLAALAILYTQRWAEAEVQSCLPAEVDHVPDAGEMVEADPFSPTENQHYPAIPTNAKQPTTAELRKRCIAYNSTLPQGDPRRIAGAARLTKAQALKALAIA